MSYQRRIYTPVIILQVNTPWKSKRRWHITTQRIDHWADRGWDRPPARVNQWNTNISPVLLLASEQSSLHYGVFYTGKKKTSKLKILPFGGSSSVNALELKQRHTSSLRWLAYKQFIKFLERKKKETLKCVSCSCLLCNVFFFDAL